MNRKVEPTEPLLTVRCAKRVGKVGFAKLLNRRGPLPVLVNGLVTVSQLGESLEIVHEQSAGETMTPKLPLTASPPKTKPSGKSVSRTEIEVQFTASKGRAENVPSNAIPKPGAKPTRIRRIDLYTITILGTEPCESDKGTTELGS